MEGNLTDKIQTLILKPQQEESGLTLYPSGVESENKDGTPPINPPDTTDLEIMLREQLAALNNLATRFISRANACATSPHQINIAEKYATTGIRLVNAIRAGMETLAKLQNKGKQQIIVQHIHVAGDAKAMIAGSINKGGGCPDKPTRGDNDE